MTIINTKDPKVWGYLYHWFIPYDQDRLLIGAELYHRLTETPDDTYVSIIVEDDAVIGVLIGYIINETDALIWQAKAKPSLKQSRQILDGFIDWAKEKGMKQIVAFSDRARSLSRRYGFTLSGNLLTKEI